VDVDGQVGKEEQHEYRSFNPVSWLAIEEPTGGFLVPVDGQSGIASPFNRYLDPDIDIDALRVEPKLVLSSRHELWLPLRWIAIVREQTRASLAATSGIHFTEDVIKALLAGADVTMLASVLLRRGPQYLGTLIRELEHWLHEKGYASVEQLKGSMDRGSCPDPSSWERANYTRAIVSFAGPA
jgi:dihydroorotate dehydrogenase (fumarate)